MCEISHDGRRLYCGGPLLNMLYKLTHNMATEPGLSEITVTRRYILLINNYTSINLPKIKVLHVVRQAARLRARGACLVRR